uniref:Uncharacterized protein n=1 Tax=Rhizophora mucronata TaxID=61149 RepID=A0A2P2PL96_RHIMU
MIKFFNPFEGSKSK